MGFLRVSLVGASLLLVSVMLTAGNPVEPPPMQYRDWMDAAIDHSMRTQTLIVRPINQGTDEFLTQVAVNLVGPYAKRNKDMEKLPNWAHYEGDALDAIDEIANWMANSNGRLPDKSPSPAAQARLAQAVSAVLATHPDLAAAPLDPNAISQSIAANVAPIVDLPPMYRIPRSSGQQWYYNWSEQTHLALARVMLDVRLQAAGRQLPSSIDQLPPPSDSDSYGELASRGVIGTSPQAEANFDRVRALVEQLPQAFVAPGEDPAPRRAFPNGI